MKSIYWSFYDCPANAFSHCLRRKAPVLFWGYVIKIMSLTLLLFAGVSFFAARCWAQGDQLNPPNEIPPSGQTQQFEKYGNFPPGAYNGIPNISILLYTVTDGDLTVPITLNYYAEGCKPSSPNGFVGMNWTLIAGGKISRTIVGQPDENNAPTTTYTAAQLDAMTLDQRSQILDGWQQAGYDTEPDMFSYNFNGHTGKFVLNRNDKMAAVLLPYKPIKIVPEISGYINSFNVTDESGVKYVFNSSETADLVTGNAFTTWDMASMLSPKGRMIKFVTGTGPTEFTAGNRIDYFVIQDTQESPNGIYRNCFATNGATESFADVLPYYSPGEVFQSDQTFLWDDRRSNPAKADRIEIVLTTAFRV